MKNHKDIFQKLENEIRKEVLAIQYETPDDVLVAKEEMYDEINALKFEVMKWFDDLYVDSLHKANNGSIYKYEFLNKIKNLNEMSLLKLDEVIYDYLVNKKEPISLKFLVGHIAHRMSSNYFVIMKELKEVLEEEGMLEIRYNLSYPNGETMFVGLDKEKYEKFFLELKEYSEYKMNRFSKDFIRSLTFTFKTNNEDGETVQSELYYFFEDYEEDAKQMLTDEVLYLVPK